MLVISEFHFYFLFFYLFLYSFILLFTHLHFFFHSYTLLLASEIGTLFLVRRRLQEMYDEEEVQRRIRNERNRCDSTENSSNNEVRFRRFLFSVSFIFIFAFNSNAPHQNSKMIPLFDFNYSPIFDGFRVGGFRFCRARRTCPFSRNKRKCGNHGNHRKYGCERDFCFTFG